MRAVPVILAGLILAAPPAALHASTEKRPSKEYSVEQFMATTSISGASFSPDERKLFFSSNQTGIFNVYSITAAGGTRRLSRLRRRTRLSRASAAKKRT